MAGGYRTGPCSSGGCGGAELSEPRSVTTRARRGRGGEVASRSARPRPARGRSRQSQGGVRGNLHDVRFGRSVLDVAPSAQATEGKGHAGRRSADAFARRGRRGGRAGSHATDQGPQPHAWRTTAQRARPRPTSQGPAQAFLRRKHPTRKTSALVVPGETQIKPTAGATSHCYQAKTPGNDRRGPGRGAVRVLTHGRSAAVGNGTEDP